jgi:hypothetical protein
MSLSSTFISRGHCIDINATGYQAANVHDVQPEQIFLKVTNNKP